MCPVKVTEFPLSILAGSLCEMDLIVLLILIIIIMIIKQKVTTVHPPATSLSFIAKCWNLPFYSVAGTKCQS